MKTREQDDIFLPNRKYIDTTEAPATPSSPQSPEVDADEEDPEYELGLVLGQEPGTFEEAEHHECLQLAMAKAMAVVCVWAACECVVCVVPGRPALSK